MSTRRRLILKPSAEKDLARLPRHVQRRIIAKLVALESDPHLPGSIKLSSKDPAYRVRVGDYRIVYVTDDARGDVTVTIVAHRRDVYRDL